MPIYEYECNNCGVHTTIMSSYDNFVPNHSCKKCRDGTLKNRICAPTLRLDIEPFVTEHITGNPVEVRSRRHKKHLLRENGLNEAG